MADNRLLRKQQNDLFEVFSKKNVNPVEFHWEEANWGGDLTSKLVHSAGQYYFWISRNTFNEQSVLVEKWAAKFSPSNNRRDGTSYVIKWEELRAVFSNWLDWVIEELVPDVWEAARQNELSDAAENEEFKNAKFTQEEQKLIPGALKEIKEYIIKNYELTKPQLLLLDERLGALEDASKYATKQAWLFMLIGVLSSVFTSVISSPQPWHDLLNFAANCIRHILETPLLLK